MKRSLYLSSEVHLSENDDTTEMQNRQRDSTLPEIIPDLPPDRKSSSFKGTSSVEMFLHYSQCLKLSADNKINAKNAFHLQLIDYMSNMVKNKDTQMESFQVVSSALDASTKIYASRVDRVHMDGMKMVGGLCKMAVKDNQTEIPEEKGRVKLKSPRKSKVNSNLARNVETLNSADRDDNRIHPSFLYMKKVFGDCRPGYPVFLTRLNVQDDSNKVNFVYSENSTSQANIELIKCSKQFPELPDISTLKTAKYVCEPADFIVEELTANFENIHISPSKFNIDDAIEDLNEQINMENNFGDEVTTEGFQEVNANASYLSSPCGKIEDIRHVITCNTSEYSYFDDIKLSSWAGPSYWKMPFFKRNSAEVKTKKSAKKLKPVILFQEPVNFEKEFLPGKTTKFLRRTVMKSWLSEKITYPQDVKFSIAKLQRYFLLNNRGFKIVNTSSWAATSEEDFSYDYNNLNDTQEFCPNISDVEAENEMAEAIDDPKTDMLSCDSKQNEDTNLPKTSKLNDCPYVLPTTWNLLEPSHKIPRTTVPYALVPKNVNMSQLKSFLWTVITDSQKMSPRERENISGGQEFESHIKFCDTFRKLETCLPKDTAQDLSVSLAFSALLHLCNENNLVLIGESDMSDVHIKLDDN